MSLRIRIDRLPARQPDSGHWDTTDPCLRCLSWNIGYAGLGFDSDFKADGGTMILPPSHASVARNMAAIAAHLKSAECDVAFLQELAYPSPLTRGLDVVGMVRDALPEMDGRFSANVWSRFLPPPLRVRHGMATFLKAHDARTRIETLSNEGDPVPGLLHRRYHLQVTDIDKGGVAYSLVNLHLSAFDDDAHIRRAQLTELFALIQRLHSDGREVVVAGDWNLRLTETAFPHTSDPSALFWIHDFPKEMIPKGWTLSFDPGTPTVRTNERPYRVGENYTTIIDGVMTSPGLEVARIETSDLGFAASDHHPVRFVVRPRRGGASA